MAVSPTGSRLDPRRQRRGPGYRRTRPTPNHPDTPSGSLHEGEAGQRLPARPPPRRGDRSAVHRGGYTIPKRSRRAAQWYLLVR